MNSLIESPQVVKNPTDFIQVLAEATFQEAVAAASAYYEKSVQEFGLTIPWADVVAVFCQTFARIHNMDLSGFEAPAAPQMPHDFDKWVAMMEADFGDMADAQFATVSGIPMF
jgi:hypothetical protein